MLHPQKSHLYTSKNMGSKTSVRICLNVNGSKSLQLRIRMGNSSGFFSAPAAEHRVKIAAAVTRSGSWVLLIDDFFFNTFGVSEFVFPWFLLIWWSNLPFLSPRFTLRSFVWRIPGSLLANSRLQQRGAVRLLDKIFRRKDEIFCYICCGRHAFCEESIENEYFMNWYEMVPSTYFQDIHGLERGNSPQLLLKVRCLEIQPAFLASCHESSELLPKLWSTVSPGATLRFTSFRTKIIDIWNTLKSPDDCNIAFVLDLVMFINYNYNYMGVSKN